MRKLLVILLFALCTSAQQIQINGGVSISGGMTTSTAPQVVTPQPVIVSPAALPSATVGVPYSFPLMGANGTGPYEWSVPALASSGQVDLLDYALPQTRNASHLSAPGLYKAFHLDAGMFWWLKNSTGNPWDLQVYDGTNLYWWITECGDAACQSHCPNNNCFVDPTTYKQYQTPIALAPRYLNTAVNTVGNPVIIITNGTNTINRVTGCSLLDTVNINTIEGMTWYNGSTTVGPDGNGNSITANAVIIDYFYGLTTTGASPTGGQKEEYTLQFGYGQTKWTHATWNGSSYAIDQTKIQATVTSGAAPTPNFGCQVPNYPLSGGLPPGSTITSAPQMNLSDGGGVISGTPTTAGTYNFTAQIADSKGQYGTQQFTMVVQPAVTPLSIVQTSIPAGTVNVAYSQTITATGGSGGGYAFSLVSGTWAPGITMSGGGAISGTPTQSGSFPVTVQVTDSGAHTAHQAFTLTINPAVVSGAADNRYASGGDVCTGLPADGPVSTILSKCFYTPVSGTPSPGTVRTTTAANLATTYAAAACGDVIKVTGGTTVTGPVTISGKGCDSAHWITIEGSGVVSDVNFPTEGTRTTPCFSNVTSLPNRPSYTCGSPATDTAQFVAPSGNSAILVKGADHIRFIGLEFTRVTTAKSIIFQIIDLSNTTTQTNNIIFDRCWIHGVNADGTFPQNASTDTSTTRGVWLGQSNHIAVIDSYLSDFYNNGSVASNGQTDAQAIGGGVGGIANSGWGVYKFVNNHIEGASEGIILGGSNGPPLTPTGCTKGVTCNLDVPTNVEVRRNYIFAPNSWNGNTTTINGTGWPNRKNGIEFKTGANILLEANVFENCWYSSQPYCYVFDFAPKNQMNTATDPGQCPSCLDQDYVARYNYGYNYPGALIANYTTSFVGGCAGCGMTLGRRGSIHDNLVGDKLNRGSLTLTGFDGLELATTAGPLTSISIRHNSIVNAYRSCLLFGATTVGTGNSGFDQFTFQDNICTYNTSNGASFVPFNGFAGACDTSGITLQNFLTNCINGTKATWTVDHNFVFGTASLTGWPSGNTAEATSTAMGFTNYNSGDSNKTPGNYALTGGSPGHNAASDGSDVGANIGQLNTEISGVNSY